MRISDYLAGGLDPVALMRQVGMQPDPWQARVLRSNAMRVLLLCARQTGKSSVAAVMAVHTAVFEPGALVLLLSPSMRQSQELFRRCLAVYRALGRPLPIESETTMALALETGSRIISLPGGEGTIRGFSAVRLLLVDEAAQVSDDSYYAARPMVGVSGGRIVLMSTPAGRRGFFYDAVVGESSWEQTRVPASECPRLRPEFLTEERLTMGDWRYSQEYQLAFVDDEESVFSEAALAAAFSGDVEPLWEAAS